MQRAIQFREREECPGLRSCLQCALGQGSRRRFPYLETEDNAAYFSQPFSRLTGTYKMPGSVWQPRRWESPSLWQSWEFEKVSQF